jgi:hypothetical protein
MIVDAVSQDIKERTYIPLLSDLFNFFKYGFHFWMRC